MKAFALVGPSCCASLDSLLAAFADRMWAAGYEQGKRDGIDISFSVHPDTKHLCDDPPSRPTEAET